MTNYNSDLISDFRELMGTFFEQQPRTGFSLQDYGWTPDKEHDAWDHSLGTRITGHKMRMALQHGLIPRG